VRRDDYVKALDMMAAGVPRKDICAELRIVPSILTRWLQRARKNGDTRDFRPAPPWHEEALKLAIKKVNVVEIARHFGVSRQRVYQVLAEYRDRLPALSALKSRD